MSEIFRIKYYGLNESEVSKLDARERYIERNPDKLNSDNFRQNINLDGREPTHLGEQLDSEFNLNLDLLQFCQRQHVFAIDFISSEGDLLSRYLLFHRKNLALNHQYYNFGEPIIISFFMGSLPEKVKLYTLDGLVEKGTYSY